MVIRECSEHPRGYLNTPELACVDAFERAVKEIQSRCNYTLPKADKADFLANITSMISHILPPDQYFNYIGCGAFKECYDAIGGWIIKFASNHNETGAERQILDAAKEIGLDFMFLPTIFIDLPVNLPFTYLEGCGSEYDYNCVPPSQTCKHNCSSCPGKVKTSSCDTYLITAILQPRAYTCESIAYERLPNSEAEYNKNPLRWTNGTPIPYEELIYTDCAIKSWFQDVIRIYGDATFKRLHEFIDKFDISDLRDANIGYLTTSSGDIPVFLDWMSREQVSPETSSR